MALYDFKCSKCGSKSERLVPPSMLKPVGKKDSNVLCEKCGKPCIRQMAIGVRGWNGRQEPWEYEYTHKVKPKFVKDSHGHREKFDPTRHTRGRKGGG